MNTAVERIYNGIIKENTTYAQVLAMCPTLAVTTSVDNAVGMGLATTAVLMMSNVAISAIRKFIPDKIRIPAFVVVIASFVTLIEFLLKGFVPSLYKSLGLFIPLIVVNCVILGRAEAYASKNKIIPSLFDGIGIGLGFTIGLASVAIIREILGAGKIFGLQVMTSGYQPAVIMVLAPGAFFTLGILMALINLYRIKTAKKGEKPKLVELGCSDCAMRDNCNAAHEA